MLIPLWHISCRPHAQLHVESQPQAWRYTATLIIIQFDAGFADAPGHLTRKVPAADAHSHRGREIERKDAAN